MHIFYNALFKFCGGITNDVIKYCIYNNKVCVLQIFFIYIIFVFLSTFKCTSTAHNMQTHFN
jgi:hypothetical protein